MSDQYPTIAAADLPGTPAEKMALHRFLKGLVEDGAAKDLQIAEQGRLLEAQADKIRWLEGEVSRMQAETQTERHYRQTGTLPPSTGTSTADWERRGKSRKPGWEPKPAETTALVESPSRHWEDHFREAEAALPPCTERTR